MMYPPTRELLKRRALAPSLAAQPYGPFAVSEGVAFGPANAWTAPNSGRIEGRPASRKADLAHRSVPG